MDDGNEKLRVLTSDLPNVMARRGDSHQIQYVGSIGHSCQQQQQCRQPHRASVREHLVQTSANGHLKRLSCQVTALYYYTAIAFFLQQTTCHDYEQSGHNDG